MGRPQPLQRKNPTGQRNQIELDALRYHVVKKRLPHQSRTSIDKMQACHQANGGIEYDGASLSKPLVKTSKARWKRRLNSFKIYGSKVHSSSGCCLNKESECLTSRSMNEMTIHPCEVKGAHMWRPQDTNHASDVTHSSNDGPHAGRLV